jgi:hypothetical protein
MTRLIEYLRENPKTGRFILYLGGAIILVWSLTSDTSHAYTWAEKYIPGFWALFGLVSCVVLIFFSAWLTRAGLSRKEDYYDD